MKSPSSTPTASPSASSTSRTSSPSASSGASDILPTPTPNSPASRIRLLVLDVDGVLTDGSIMLDDNGVETKRFSARDGLGIATWIRLGLELAIITKRSGKALQYRCSELGITRIVQGSADKLAALEQLIADTNIPASEIAYIGDDWPDLPPMSRVALPIAPADAAAQVRAAAAFVTEKPGGRGAVREAIEHILTAKGLMHTALAPYLSPSRSDTI